MVKQSCGSSNVSPAKALVESPRVESYGLVESGEVRNPNYIRGAGGNWCEDTVNSNSPCGTPCPFRNPAARQ